MPLNSSSPIARALARVEADHTLDVPLHHLAHVLTRTLPEDYLDAHLAPTPATCTTREARVALLAERQERGEGLFHPGDRLDLGSVLWNDQISLSHKRQAHLAGQTGPLLKSGRRLGRKPSRSKYAALAAEGEDDEADD